LIDSLYFNIFRGNIGNFVSGGNPGFLPKNLDGLDQWTSLTLNLPSQRNFVLLNIDEKQRYAGIIKDSWKLIVGEYF